MSDGYSGPHLSAGADLLGQIVNLRIDVARLEERFENHNDHNDRLRNLEAFRWKLVGLSAAAAVVVSAIVNYLPKL